MQFIKKRENIFITGSTGIGKSYIASALGHQACIEGYKVLYANATKLFAKLKMARADGTYYAGDRPDRKAKPADY